LYKTFILLLFTIIIVGCVPINLRSNEEIKIEVNAIISKDNVNGKKYYLYQSLYQNDQLQYNEFSHYVDDAIQYSGFQKVFDIKKADLIISFYYGITNPQTSHISENPLIAQNYRDLSQEYANKGTNNSNQRSSNAMMAGFYSGMASSYSHNYSVTYFGKWLSINAYNKHNFEDVWELQLITIDSSDNLRNYFPRMLNCTKQYIAKNFNDKVLCPNVKF
jgi:hypothetical protein